MSNEVRELKEMLTLQIESRTYFGKLHIFMGCLDKHMMSVRTFMLAHAEQRFITSYRKLIRSSSLQNVMTLFASSFGTENRYFRESPTRFPRELVKFSNIK